MQSLIPAGATVSCSATASSSAAAQVTPSSTHLWCVNSSATLTAFVAQGGSGIVATTATTPIPPLQGVLIKRLGNAGYVAAITTATGPAVVYVQPVEVKA
jgi:hypothetical protein